MCFPGEETAKREIARQLHGHFDCAKRLLRFWLEADKDHGFEASTLPLIVRAVLFGMSVKACRQFRSVIDLCERGEAADGSVVARAMFETALVVSFVLKPRFTPRKFFATGKVKQTIKVPGVPLSRKLRATLYFTHNVLYGDRFVAKHAGRPGMKRQSKHMAKLIAKFNAAQPYTQYR